MFYIFYGDDDLSLREALDEMKRSIQPEELRDVNVATLDARGLGYAELAATCGTVPFMAEKRLVVLEGLLSTFESGFRAGSRSAPRQTEVGDWARLPELPDEMPPTTDLVTVDGPLRSTNPLLGLLRKLRGQVEVRTFSVPRGRALIQWVQSRAERLGIPLDQALEERASEASLGRLGRPEELAHLVSFLASEKASYITGVTIRVDGGLVRSVL